MKEKKKKIIVLSIAIVAVIAIIAGSTYAYWQITRTQKNPNDIVAACLDITMENETGTFGLTKSWPMSESEIGSLSGYSFEVTNNCQESVNYIVGMNSVEGSSTDYLAYSSIRVKLDDKESSLFSDFGDIGYSDPENTQVVRDSKLLSMESLEGGATNTHNVKVWIDIDAPVTEQSKAFSGQVFITGGQGVPIYDDCFTIATDGTIMGYDYSCGTAVEVPATLAGIEVKTINQASFAVSNLQAYYLYNETTEEEKYVYYVTDENVADDVVALLKQDMCEDPTTCTEDDIEAMGLIIITTEEEYNAIDWDNYTVEGPEVGYFNPETGEIEDATSQVTSLDLSEAVYLETIGEAAFYSSEILENLILPEDGMLATIGEESFSYTSLTEIFIPASVKNIGANAFSSDDEVALTKVMFEDTEENPSKLTTIGNSAFAGNEISEIDIPDNVTEIGNHAFAHNELKQITVAAKTIGNNAFYFNQLTNVTIQDTVESIGDSAFAYNELKQITVAAKTIGNNAFNNNKLTSVTIENAVETIGTGAFYGSTEGNQISMLTFEDTEDNPSQLTEIGSSAFYANQLTTVTLPQNLETIGGSAFFGNQLIELRVGAKTIGASAFSNNKLTNVTIRSSVETIGEKAFSNGDSGNTNKITSLTFEDTESNPSQLTTIGAYAFSYSQLTNIDLPDSITKIDSYAFSNNSISTLTIPSNIVYLSGFSGNLISSITIPSSVETIGTGAFSGNDLTELVIPASVKIIEMGAFWYNEITSLTFEDTEENPSQLTLIGGGSMGFGAFANNQITKVIIPSSVDTIEIYAFINNSNLQTVIIKNTEGNVTINSSAFNSSPTITYDPNYTE